MDLIDTAASQDRGEFVAADAGQRVRVAQAAPQALGDLLEEKVAEFVAEGVVDVGEIVEIDQQHGGAVVYPPRLGAFREVGDGLASRPILAEQTRAQDEAVAAAEHAVRLSQLQYREGAASYFEVIDADRSVLQQRRTTVQLDGERARTTVALIRALGGGWETFASQVLAAAAR